MLVSELEVHQYTAVSTRYGLKGEGIRVRLPEGARDLVSTASTETDIEPPPIQFAPGELFVESKADGA